MRWLGKNHVYVFFGNQRVSFAEYVRRYVTYDSDAALEEGLYLSQIGNIPFAIEKLRRGLEKSPLSACGHHAMSKAMVKIGEIRKAIEHACRAAEIEPADPRLRNALGLLIRDESPQDAGRELRCAVTLDPLSAGYHHDLGCFLMKNGDLDGAEPFLEKASELAPGTPAYRSSLTICYAKKGRTAEAVASAGKETELSPNSPHAFAFMASLLARSDDLSGAERASRVAVTLAPNVGQFHDQLGQFLFRQGKVEKAVAEAEKAVALAPSNEIFRKHLSAMRVRQS
jgi:Flp pilus assembly protein TadD